MLQVGFGVGDITPEVGMEMPGGFTRRTSKGVRDKLLAVACVVYDGTTLTENITDTQTGAAAAFTYTVNIPSTVGASSARSSV